MSGDAPESDQQFGSEAKSAGGWDSPPADRSRSPTDWESTSGWGTLAKFDPRDVTGIAAFQQDMLTKYYDEALAQARTGFKWALWGSAIGLAFFMAAIVFVVGFDKADAATVSLIAGGIIEVIAGLLFVLHTRASAQLHDRHVRLDRTQLFVLAHSISKGLEDSDAKTACLTDLVKVVSHETNVTAAGEVKD